jgi:hypothetical protein
LELLHQLHLLSVNRLGWDNNQVYSVEVQLSKVQASLGSHQAWGSDQVHSVLAQLSKPRASLGSRQV